MKVWYQNRRTKHKRQGDEEGSESDAGSDSGSGALDVANRCGNLSGDSSASAEEVAAERRVGEQRREGHATFRIAHNNASNTDLRTS